MEKIANNILKIFLATICVVVMGCSREMAIPLTFRAYRNNNELFESAVFSGTDPDGIESVRRDILVEQVVGLDDVYVIYNKTKPNMILAFVDFSKGIHYPQSNVKPNEYDIIGEDFNRIQAVIGENKELKDYE
jgi:hypothetical protein